jgi:NitT/TauT family transport system substrate-binding protein
MTARHSALKAWLMGLGVGALALALAGPVAAQGLDKVTLRTNWLFYGSHSIFFLGIDRGYYEEEGIDLVVKQGNGSSNAVRLVANKDSDFAYGSSATMMNLAAQGAPVVSVAVIDAQGTEAILVRPDAGVKVIKDLEGKQIMTTAGAGVNTFFPVVTENAGLDMSKIELVNVAEGALVTSYLQNLAPAILGGIDDKPAEIVANGGEPPVIFPYSDYGVYQPGYSIVAHKDMVAENPDLVGRFVRATLKATQAAKDDPEAAIQALINWSGSVEDQKEQARQVLDVTLSVLESPNANGAPLGSHVEEDWQSALDLLKQYKELQTDMAASDFYTNQFIPQ